ncbi:MAG TPA: hypothetical protein DCE80_01875 [Ignavibacteriales bacterium]|nr:hypothetical protein [Ignavibacteriales bacterium]
MKYLLSITIIISANFSILSQRLDTTIFNSAFEKQLFQKVIDSQVFDPMELFFSMNYHESSVNQSKNKLNNFYKEIAPELISKQIKKQIKTIYKRTHSHFLTKYEEKSFFENIFENGTFNCVSATALYALVLETYHIEYVIKETLQHVYLIADPKRDQVFIETTLPSKGTFYVDEHYKKNYVEYLENNKIISESEFKTQSTESLFDKYYDENKTITLKELAGIQYFNDGIFNYEASKFVEASKSFEKAFILYPSNSIKLAYHTALLALLNEQHQTKKYSAITLAKFINLNKNNNEAKTLTEDYFGLLTEELVINHPQLGYYEKQYHDFQDYISDSIDIKIINQQYFYYTGYANYIQQDLPKALVNLNKSFELNPDNINTKQLIQEVVSNHIFKDVNRERELDSLKIYFSMYPFLLKNDKFQIYFTYCYLRIIGEAMHYNDVPKAMKYLSVFEDQIKLYPDIVMNDKYVELAYGELASYYIRKTKYNEAEKYYLKGLALAPNSYELKKQKELLSSQKTGLNEYLNDSKNYDKINNELALEIPKNPDEKSGFKESMDTFFPGSWEAVNFIEDGQTKAVPKDEKLVIIAKPNNKLEFNMGGIKETGRWAIRNKGHLLYLIPKDNENDYLVFKVVEISKNTLKLQAYDGGKLENIIVQFKAITQ